VAVRRVFRGSLGGEFASMVAAGAEISCHLSIVLGIAAWAE
jgi:hypothetical protein